MKNKFIYLLLALVLFLTSCNLDPSVTESSTDSTPAVSSPKTTAALPSQSAETSPDTLETPATPDATASNETTDPNSPNSSDALEPPPYTAAYTVLERRGYDCPSFLGAHHKDEVVIPTFTRYTRSDAPSTVSFNINGIEYTAPYAYSYKGQYNDDIIYDCYDQDNSLTSFHVNTVTGKLEQFFLDYDHDAIENLKTQDECLEIAVDYVEKIFSSNKYELVKQSVYHHYYIFEFAYILDGIQTIDKVGVGVTKNGFLYLFSAINQGAMDDAPKISGKEMADILASIDAKINYIYYGFSDEYICTYDIEKMIYSTYNGKRYLDCEIDVYMIPLVDNNKADNSPYFVKLYVCLD